MIIRMNTPNEIFYYPELVNRVSSESHKTCFNGRVASEEKPRSGLISDWLAHGVGISDELQEHGGCRFASADVSRESPQGDSRWHFTNSSKIPFCRMGNVTNSLIRDKNNRDISSRDIFADNQKKKKI